MDTIKLDLAAYMSGSISRIMAKAYKSNLHCKGCYARSNGIADERCARLQHPYSPPCRTKVVGYPLAPERRGRHNT